MEWNIYTIVILVWAAWNIFTFTLMGIDKLLAKMHKWRISEATLLGTAFCMGAVGSIAGSKVFHHKTQKKKFRIGLPAALIFNLLAAGGFIYLISKL